MTRPLSVIAREILADWNRVSLHAAPYLTAMSTLDSVHDMYGADSAKSVILYFLSNAQGWRGETARRVKAELKAMVK